MENKKGLLLIAILILSLYFPFINVQAQETELNINSYAKMDLNGQLTLNNQLSLKYSSLEPNLNLNVKSKEIVFNYTSYDLKCYELDKSNIEYLIIIKDPLKENFVNFELNIKGLTSYYQDSLLNELNPKDYDLLNDTHAIKDKQVMYYRPINIVDSFAFYNSNGIKVLHLYRSIIRDSKGLETFGKYLLKDNILTINIPQEFLDKAVYPIYIDPTFGKTDIGGTLTGGWSYRMYGTHVTTVEAGTLTDIWVYISGGDNENLVSGIYYDDEANNKPTTLLKSSDNTFVNSTTGWKIFHFTTAYDFSGSTDYWLIIVCWSGNGLYCDSGGSTVRSNYNDPMVCRDPFGTIQSSTSETLSIYGVYTSLGGAEYSRNISQTLSFTSSTSRLTEFSRSVTQSFNLIFSTNRIIELIRPISETLTFTLGSAASYGLWGYPTLTFTLSETVNKIIEVSRPIMETLTFSFNALGYLNNAFTRTVNLTFNLIEFTQGFFIYSQIATKEYVLAVALIIMAVIISLIMLYRN
jgi:hypothetical protein